MTSKQAVGYSGTFLMIIVLSLFLFSIESIFVLLKTYLAVLQFPSTKV